MPFVQRGGNLLRGKGLRMIVDLVKSCKVESARARALYILALRCVSFRSSGLLLLTEVMAR